MKILKVKLVTALVLGAISFGMFSFTTTPINAQVTNSVATVAETEVEVGLWTSLGKAFVRGIIYGAGLDFLIGGSNNSVNYPSNTLD